VWCSLVVAYVCVYARVYVCVLVWFVVGVCVCVCVCVGVCVCVQSIYGQVRRQQPDINTISTIVVRSCPYTPTRDQQ